MQEIEPYYNWRHLYVSEKDEKSPFFEQEYSEFTYSDRIYNFYIHPQWDNMGSPTLFLKLIYIDYNTGHAIVELMGEWNDCINNDIMYFKREIADHFGMNGINKYILIGENVLNFHYSDDSYYEEWFDDIEDGYIVAVNFHEHVLREFNEVGLDNYILWGGVLNDLEWRANKPQYTIAKIDALVNKRLS